jgi:paraquat-inducible protein A
MTIACSDCGTLEELAPLAPRNLAFCPICDNKLEATSGRTITGALACSLGTLLLLFPSNLVPIMSVSMLGEQRSTLLGSGVVSLWDQNWIVLAALIGAFAIILPFIRFGLLSASLGAIRFGYRPWWLGRAFRWASWLDVWAMPDVFLIGCFVGYSRVSANLTVNVMPGGYCFIAAAFLSMISRATLDRRTTWHAILPDREVDDGAPMLSCITCDLVMPVSAAGTRCPRCNARLVIRKTDSVIRTAALILAAFILFWPANIYPMNISMQMGTIADYRIIDGIRDLFDAGLAPLGVLIFFTSIVIPAAKICGLAWCLVSILRKSQKHLVGKTKLFRLIDELGRWSNVDPFTLAVFIPLMNFGSLVNQRGGAGATSFILVVVLTLMASHSFDPRLMWDAAPDAQP